MLDGFCFENFSPLSSLDGRTTWTSQDLQAWTNQHTTEVEGFVEKPPLLKTNELVLRPSQWYPHNAREIFIKSSNHNMLGMGQGSQEWMLDKSYDDNWGTLAVFSA